MLLWRIFKRVGGLIFVMAVGILSASMPARAHPELTKDEMDATVGTIDPQTGKPYSELKPVWLSPTSAIHEDQLKESFNLSNIHNRVWDDKAKLESDETSYMKGVYWNDSPERGLCLWCSVFDANLRAGGWLIRFKAAQAAVAQGRTFTHGSPVLERSHFGDLAFIHGMATKDGQPAAATRRHVMIWAEFAYKVATGKISALTKIRDVKVDDFSEVFNAHDTDIYDRDIRFLFSDPHDATMFIDVRRIALGSLLHLIQDSYSPAHIERTNHDAEAGRFCRGAIHRFLAYSNQVVKKHSAADKWPANLPRNSLKSDARICDPITAGSAVMKLYARNDFAGADWEEVRNFLETSVFALNAHTLMSGPGEDFKQ